MEGKERGGRKRKGKGEIEGREEMDARGTKKERRGEEGKRGGKIEGREEIGFMRDKEGRGEAGRGRKEEEE